MDINLYTDFMEFKEKIKRTVKNEKQLNLHISLEFRDAHLVWRHTEKKKKRSGGKSSGRSQKFKIEPADVNAHKHQKRMCVFQNNMLLWWRLISNVVMRHIFFIIVYLFLLREWASSKNAE